MREAADPTQREKVVKLLLHDAGFVDTIARGSTCYWVSVAGVNAELIVQHGAADADGDERVPVFLNGGGESSAEVGIEVLWKVDNFVELGLVFRCVPGDAIRAGDGKVEGVGGLAEDGGAAVRREKVEVFVDIIWGGI